MLPNYEYCSQVTASICQVLEFLPQSSGPRLHPTTLLMIESGLEAVTFQTDAQNSEGQSRAPGILLLPLPKSASSPFLCKEIDP